MGLISRVSSRTYRLFKIIFDIPINNNMADEFYEIDEILSHKPESATRHEDTETYHVHWLGFDDCENSDEPAVEIAACELLIEAYWKKVNGKTVESDDDDEKVNNDNAVMHDEKQESQEKMSVDSEKQESQEKMQDESENHQVDNNDKTFEINYNLLFENGKLDKNFKNHENRQLDLVSETDGKNETSSKDSAAGTFTPISDEDLNRSIDKEQYFMHKHYVEKQMREESQKKMEERYNSEF